MQLPLPLFGGGGVRNGSIASFTFPSEFFDQPVWCCVALVAAPFQACPMMW